MRTWSVDCACVQETGGLNSSISFATEQQWELVSHMTTLTAFVFVILESI